MNEIIFCGTPEQASTVKSRVRLTESYALFGKLRSIKHTYNGIHFVRANPYSRRTTSIISVVEVTKKKWQETVGDVLKALSKLNLNH